MSITDELREWASSELSYKTRFDELIAIADRIDERVENIRSNEHHKGYQDGIMDGCSHYDPERTECMVSEEHGYIKLPVDADGEPIHVDDWIINPDISNQKHKVAAITTESVYWWGEDGCHWRYSHLVRHYHEPTVEDVLREFANMAKEHAWPDFNDLVDEYAKRIEKAVEHECD